MNKVTVDLGDRSYDIIIGNGILDGIGSAISGMGFSGRLAVISNPTVFALYGERVLSAVKNAGFDAYIVIIPDGEEYKDFHWAYYILSELLKAGLDRKSIVIGLGGGVIGDITGFAASTYMRGISCVQIPTTLLAQVDSSVGGKTGVNHPLGKNMIGTFYQPRLVWCDMDTLKTLPGRQILAGIAEIIKYGVIRDRGFFDFLSDNRDLVISLDSNTIAHIVKRSCEIKAEVVSKDERESGVRAILNFGHTIGHAVETVTGYSRYLHGEGVAIGMHVEARLAAAMSLLNAGDVDVIKNILDLYGLPSEIPGDVNIEGLIKAMQIDKKAVSGGLTFILPDTIGSVRIINNIDKDVLLSVLNA